MGNQFTSFGLGGGPNHDEQDVNSGGSFACSRPPFSEVRHRTSGVPSVEPEGRPLPNNSVSNEEAKIVELPQRYRNTRFVCEVHSEIH